MEESAGVGQVVDGEKPDSTRLLTCHAGNYRGRRPVRGKMSNVLPSCKKYASAFASGATVHSACRRQPPPCPPPLAGEAECAEAAAVTKRASALSVG